MRRVLTCMLPRASGGILSRRAAIPYPYSPFATPLWQAASAAPPWPPVDSSRSLIAESMRMRRSARRLHSRLPSHLPPSCVRLHQRDAKQQPRLRANSPRPLNHCMQTSLIADGSTAVGRSTITRGEARRADEPSITRSRGRRRGAQRRLMQPQTGSRAMTNDVTTNDDVHGICTASTRRAAAPKREAPEEQPRPKKTTRTYTNSTRCAKSRPAPRPSGRRASQWRSAGRWPKAPQRNPQISWIASFQMGQRHSPHALSSISRSCSFPPDHAGALAPLGRMPATPPLLPQRHSPCV